MVIIINAIEIENWKVIRVLRKVLPPIELLNFLFNAEVVGIEESHMAGYTDVRIIPINNSSIQAPQNKLLGD